MHVYFLEELDLCVVKGMSEDWEQFFSVKFDQEIGQTILGENEERENTKNPVLSDSHPSFNCLGEVDTGKVEVHNEGFFNSPEELYYLGLEPFPCTEDKVGVVSLFGRTWDKGSSFYRLTTFFFKKLSKEIMMLEQSSSLGVTILGNSLVWNSNCQMNFKDSRFHCVEFLLFLRRSLKLLNSKPSYSWVVKEILPNIIENLKALKRHIGRLIDLPEHVYTHAANSNGNKSNQASYHLIHLHLDIRWIHIGLLYDISKIKNVQMNVNLICSDSDLVFTEIKSIVCELIDLSLVRFEKTEIHLIRQRSPFNCSCVQEFWLLLIKHYNILHTNSEKQGLWDIINLFINVNSIENGSLGELAGHEINSSLLPIFSIWMTYHLARLHHFIDKELPCNYPLLESSLKVLLGRDVSEANLRSCLVLVERLCLEIWEPRAEVLLILWEYFHKKINSSFYVPGAAPSTLAIVSKTPKGLINQLKSYLDDMNNVVDSFQHFLRIIGVHLLKSKSVPRHWNILKGRLYSKLTLNKLESLSNVGEYHFISLYLILAISQDINEIANKMVDIINSFLNKRNYLSEELVKGQLGLVLLLLENEKDASSALSPISTYFKSLSISENSEIFRLYVQTFQDILSLNVPLSYGQHLLIDKWISDYLLTSSKTDVYRLLDTIVSLLNRLKLYCDYESPDQKVIVMIEKLWDELKSYLEYTSSQNEMPYQVAGIAASLATISLKASNKERFTDIVNMFAEQNVTDISVMRQFVWEISQMPEVINVMPNFDKVVIKAWLKCSFLYSDVDHSEMKDLTRTVTKLPEMSDLVGNEVLNISLSSEPLVEFLSCLHRRYATEDIWKRQGLRERVSLYLEGLEKWVKPLINPPRDAGRLLSLYKTVGTMIRLISPLIYSKSKPNTLLQQLIDLLLLPMNMRNPDSKIHFNILGAVKATLHLFIEGLIYLDPESDHYISRVLKELILVYVPHCMTTQNSNALTCGTFGLITSFPNFDISSRQLILNLVMDNFLKKKARSSHPQAPSALKFIKELLNTHKKNEGVFFAVVNGGFDRLCDVLMYCEEKSSVSSSAKEILQLILNSETFRNSTKSVDDLMSVLGLICQENLAWSSRQLFELLVLLSSMAPDIIRRFTPTLLEQVKQVEAKRGVGYDRTLRLGIEKIEMRLRAIKEAT